MLPLARFLSALAVPCLLCVQVHAATRRQASSPAFAEAGQLLTERKWEEAASAMFRIHKNPRESAASRKRAGLALVQALYEMKWYRSAYEVLRTLPREVASAQESAFPWWIRLASMLPESDEILDELWQATELESAASSEKMGDLPYWIGRSKYQHQAYEEAISWLQRVPRGSAYEVPALFFTGAAHVQQHRAKPAIQSFQKILQRLAQGVKGDFDPNRLRDLAVLSMARTFYSSAVQVDDNNVPTVNAERLSAAVKHWNLVDLKSEYWLDALFEESWAYVVAGDYARALGNIHTLQSPYFVKSSYPEAEVLKAVIAFFNCQYDVASSIVSGFDRTYKPVYTDLVQRMETLRQGDAGENTLRFLESVQQGVSNLTATVESMVKAVLVERQSVSDLEALQKLEQERAQIQNASPVFRDTPLAKTLLASLQTARLTMRRNAGQRALARLQEKVDTLGEHLRNTTKIAIEILAAQRNEIDQALKVGQVTQLESKRNAVRSDAEHRLWPFNGEYWRNELGTYRQNIVSKCGR